MFAATDVQYLPDGGARAAVVLADDSAFAPIAAEETVLVPEVAPYQPGEFFRRELPALRAGRYRLPDALRRVDQLARGR